VSRTPAQDGAPPDLPGYRFVRPIGRGGSAQVYLYEQGLPHREVAVKVLNESALSDGARRRFAAEANVTAGLAHRHIVQVFDANVTPEGRPYLVMPYYPRPNLSVRARREHFSVAEVLSIGIQIGGAVETSHRHDVLHRDIKPQNILTDSYGELVLTDFGIAAAKGDDGPEALSVPWSPPEILYGTGRGDQRSDVYSLGATLWHLLVGRSPFEEPGGDNTNFALSVRIKSAPVPRTQRADVPESLERLLRQAMAKDPAARPQTAMDLIRGLQSVEQELRLPLTRPILAADGSARADTGEADTVTRPPGPGPAQDIAGQAAWRPGPGTHPGRPSPIGPWDPASPAERSGPWQPAPAVERVGPWEAAPAAERVGPWGPAPAAEPGGPWGPAPAAGRDAAARRSPMPVTGWTTAAPASEDTATRVRGPIRLDPQGGPAAHRPAPLGSDGPGQTARPRQFPAEPADPATVARPAAAAGAAPFGPTDEGAFRRPDADPFGRTGAADASGAAAERGAAGQGRGGRRALALAGGGTLLAVAVVAAALALARGGGGPAPAGTADAQATQSGGANNALGPGTTTPGQPTVTAHRATAGQVEFSWTYANTAVGDRFFWRETKPGGGSAQGVVTEPRLLLPVAAGQSACVTVQVRSTDGQASTESDAYCSQQ
jgi:hypothetical protein